jgi:septal ring factor EnvC (AmiA/AmiB activator)
MKPIDYLKKYWKLGVLAVAVYIGFSMAFKACDLTDAYSIKVGEYTAIKRQAELDRRAAERDIKNLEKSIKDRDKILEDKQKELERKYTAIDNLNGDLAKLKTALGAAQTDAERVVLLTQEVQVWVNKFSLAEGIIADKDAQILVWKGKYDIEVQIAARFKALYDGLLSQTEACDAVNRQLAKELRVSRFGSKIKSGVVIGVVAYVAYTLIKD